MKLLMSLLIVFTSSLALAKKNVMGLDLVKSKLDWVGAKKIGDKHNGQVSLISGFLVMDNSKISKGEFHVDMDSITNADVKSPEWRKKLVGHLKSNDFFDVETYPTASFKIKSSTPVSGKKNQFKIQGDMTIRGVTNSESFVATITPMGKGHKATGKLSFDRNKYKVSYNSEASILSKAVKIAKDKIISDTVHVTFNLATRAQ